MVSGGLNFYRAVPVGSQRQGVANAPCSCGSRSGIYTSLPPIFDGIESVEAFPVYLWISTVPSLSTLYSKSPKVSVLAVKFALSVNDPGGRVAAVPKTMQIATAMESVSFFNLIYHTEHPDMKLSGQLSLTMYRLLLYQSVH